MRAVKPPTVVHNPGAPAVPKMRPPAPVVPPEGTVEVLDASPVQSVDPTRLPMRDGQVVADATAVENRYAAEPAEDEREPVIRRYVVLRDWTGMVGGQPGVRLTAGKVVTDQLYDVRKLVAAGARLQELKGDEDPFDIIMARTGS